MGEQLGRHVGDGGLAYPTYRVSIVPPVAGGVGKIGFRELGWEHSIDVQGG